MEEVLLKVTKVPLRWPAFISTDINEGHPLYVNLVSESAADYKVELGWTEDCIGGSYCHYGTVRGSATPIAESDAAVQVKLRGGIAGYFIDVKCGATRCNDAEVGWSEGEYHYLVSVRNGKKSDLIKIANSALLRGTRPSTNVASTPTSVRSITRLILMATFVVTLAGGLCWLSVGARAQSQAPLQSGIQVDVNLVLIDATVKNKAGEIMGNLKKEDFEVREDGVRRRWWCSAATNCR